MKIKGKNFRLLQGGVAFPESTNCSISLTGNAEDTSTKDTEGLYTQQTITSTSWSAQVDTYQSEPSELKAVISIFTPASMQAL